MWKPNDVVPRHRKRARFIWAGLLFSIFAYTIWQIVEIALERQNPTTSLTISNDLYRFPYLRVCMWEDYGCSSVDPSDCASTAPSIMAQVFYNGAETVDGVQVENAQNCIDFDMTSIDPGDGDKNGVWTPATLQMFWVSSEDASADEIYTESVGVFLGASVDDLNEFTYVPYSRVILTDTNINYSKTSMTIGKTVRKNIAGDKSTTYPVLTLSTTGISEQITPSATTSAEDYAYGIMFLDIIQGSFSLSNIKEIDPLEIGTLLGNIGGFWEILIIVWGLCFIATTHQPEPTLKARNFSKSIQQGTEIVTRRRSLSEAASTRSEPREDRPQWEAAYRASANNSTQQSQHQQTTLFDASHKRPVTVAVPQRNGTPATSFGVPPTAADGSPPSYAQFQQA